MSRYADTATLQDVAVSIGDEGEAIETVTETYVFCNTYRIGMSAWLAARSAGLHADAEIEVRSMDYSGQQRVVLDDVTYEVERVDCRGEFTRLTLSRRLND